MRDFEGFKTKNFAVKLADQGSELEEVFKLQYEELLL